MTVLHEGPVKATRKRHVCESCNQAIPIGRAATKWVGITDGQFYACYFHPECRVAEVAWNRMMRLGWDEWCNLANDLEIDDWPWLLEEYPVVALRLGLSRVKYDEAMQERERCRAAFASFYR